MADAKRPVGRPRRYAKFEEFEASLPDLMTSMNSHGATSILTHLLPKSSLRLTIPMLNATNLSNIFFRYATCVITSSIILLCVFAASWIEDGLPLDPGGLAMAAYSQARTTYLLFLESRVDRVNPAKEDDTSQKDKRLSLNIIVSLLEFLHYGQSKRCA